MSESDQVLNKIEYYTYRTLKKQNDEKQIEMEQNNIIISQLKNQLNKLQLEKEHYGKELLDQEQEIKNLDSEIKIIKSKNDIEIYNLQNQLRSFEPRYLEQEKKNENVFSTQEFRKPNLYFCDIEKGLDGNIFVKIVFQKGFKIEKLDTKLPEYSVDVIACLQNDQFSHIVKHHVSIAQQNMKCLATVVQGNEVTFKYGEAT